MKDIYKTPQWKVDKLEEDIQIDSIAVEDDFDEIQHLININEIEGHFESNFISSIEWCRNNTSSTKTFAEPSRLHGWSKKYTMTNTYLPSDEIDWSHKDHALTRKQF